MSTSISQLGVSWQICSMQAFESWFVKINSSFCTNKIIQNLKSYLCIYSIGNNHLGGPQNMTPLLYQGGQAQRGTTAPLRATEILASVVDTC